MVARRPLCLVNGLPSELPSGDTVIGAGTVTSVSVTTANGISGTVLNSTTTPAISLSLGAITPSTVNGLTFTSLSNGFTITGGTTPATLTVSSSASVSGTNTGDQIITLTGDVTGSGSSSFATSISNNAVTFAKFQAISANTIVGNFTSSTANIQTLSLASNQLLGRGSTGNISAISLGTGLSFSSAILSATSQVGGSNTNVQYNNSGTFAGSSDFTFDSSGINLKLASPSSTTSALNSILLGGNTNTINSSADYSIISGQAGVARYQSSYVVGHSKFSVNGDAQRGTVGLRATTTNATQTDMTIDGAVATTTTLLVLQNNSTWNFRINIVARTNTATGKSAGFVLEGLINRGATASTTEIVGSIQATRWSKNSNSWEAFAFADTSTGALSIKVIGESGTTIYWNALVEWIEITF